MAIDTRLALLKEAVLKLKADGVDCAKDYECDIGKCQHDKCGGYMLFAKLNRALSNDLYTVIFYGAILLMLISIFAYLAVSQKGKPREKQPASGQ